MKKAIVIGATSGIGKELAKQLVKKEYKVGITGRRTNLLDELKATNPASYITHHMDITDNNSIIEKLEKLTEDLGGLDLLVLSSGTGDLNKELNFDIEKRTIDTNVTGFTQITTWAFRYFQKQQSGHLVAISSIGGLRGTREGPSYNATKAYQINYFEALRQKATVEKIPIHITDIRPGLVDTDMAKGEGLFWIMPVEKTVKQIIKKIEKKKRVAYVTRRWALIALLLKILPASIYERM